MANHRLKPLIVVMGLWASVCYSAAGGDVNVGLVQPLTTVIDHSISEAQSNIQSLAARRYYTFWHTGNGDFAKAALDAKFQDLNLPPGRPQGPEGPLQASKHFREAVPDLNVEVKEMMIVGDRVIGRLHFTGHFTGRFMGEQGNGQAVDFSAVDIYRIAQGKIIENWHLEDNLSLLQQLGKVSVKK